MRLLRRTLLVLGLLVLAACDISGGSPGEQPEPGEAATLSEVEDDEAVDDGVELTIYLRNGTSQDARLQAVKRTVPVEGNLAKRAVELMLEGGTDDETLDSPWPDGTEVLGVTVTEGVATVDLSDDALRSTPAEESAAHLELLALAALGNTLTEFPTIEQVRITVDGEGPESSTSVTNFWGGWKMPERITRDETLVTEQGSGIISSLDDFSTESQSIGTGDAEPVHIRSIRVRDRITYVRVVVEIGAADAPDEAPEEFPKTQASTLPGQVWLEIAGVESTAQDAVVDERIDMGLEQQIGGLRVADGQRANSVRVTLEPMSDEAPSIHLHSASSPSRLFLDIKK